MTLKIMTVSRRKQYKTRVEAMVSLQLYKLSIIFLVDSIVHHTSTTQKKQVPELSLLESLH